MKKMKLKKLYQWSILLSCITASALNILYLLHKCSQHATTVGFILLLLCWGAGLLLKKRFDGLPASKDSPSENIRGIMTALFSIIWLVTTGIALVGIH